MSTMNISLPSQQVTIVDRFVTQYGFANRSEFIRSLVRLVTREPKIMSDAATYPFVAPVSTSRTTILHNLAKTKKYSKALLADLEAGMAESSYFTK